MQKYWVVLKVSLTRPWVWLMALLAGTQLIPLVVVATSSRSRSELQVSLPGFDSPDVVVSDTKQLLEFASRGELGTITAFRTRGLPFNFFINESGQLVGDPEMRIEPARIYTSNSWPLFEQVPQLKYLEMQPPNMLSTKGWQRIGKLSHLEVLNLQSVGSPDSDSMKTSGPDLEAALSHLTKLRQLNVSHAGSLDWTLPALPNLEEVILGYNLKLEQSLQGLATHSPKLRTLTLYTVQDMVYTEGMLNALRRMPSLRRLYVVSTSKTDDHWEETNRQVEWLRGRLPGISIFRGHYILTRVLLCGFLLLFTIFLPFIAWFQAGLTLAQPLAAVMPGHRQPHIFWPIVASLVAMAVYVTAVVLQGATFPSALAIACLASMIVANVLPGHELREDWRRISNTLSMTDALALFTLLGTAIGFPATFESFLVGDYPVLASLLMVWFLMGAAWKIVRATRLHRILAESGMPGIPGLNMGVHQVHNQPFKPAPGWSIAGWQFKQMESAIDRRIAHMDRNSWTDMLRRANPANPGFKVGFVMMLVFMGVIRYMMNRGGASHRAGIQPLISVGMMQATMMIVMMNTMMWVGRRSSIAADFLRPISRPHFWNSLRAAIFRDLLPAVLFVVAGGSYTIYQGHQRVISPQTVMHLVIVVLGAFAFVHSWVFLMVIGRRLWLHATLGVATSTLILGASGAAVILTVVEKPEPLYAALLAIGVLAAGVAMQWGVHRKLPDWELG